MRAHRGLARSSQMFIASPIWIGRVAGEVGAS
jgi:hypothetical protein